MNATLRLAVPAAIALLAGCSHIEPRVAMPEVTTVKPRAIERAPATNGAIFQANAPFRGLAEDRRPMYPGDILTIAIAEKSAASRSSKSAATKTGEFKAEMIPIWGRDEGAQARADVHGHARLLQRAQRLGQRTERSRGVGAHLGEPGWRADASTVAQHGHGAVSGPA